jgi:hypothetical protein
MMNGQQVGAFGKIVYSRKARLDMAASFSKSSKREIAVCNIQMQRGKEELNVERWVILSRSLLGRASGGSESTQIPHKFHAAILLEVCHVMRKRTDMERHRSVPNFEPYRFELRSRFLPVSTVKCRDGIRDSQHEIV